MLKILLQLLHCDSAFHHVHAARKFQIAAFFRRVHHGRAFSNFQSFFPFGGGHSNDVAAAGVFGQLERQRDGRSGLHFRRAVFVTVGQSQPEMCSASTAAPTASSAERAAATCVRISTQ